MGSLVDLLAKRKWPEQPSLYYPCAGQDWLGVTASLGVFFTHLKFCDLHYSFDKPPQALPEGWEPLQANWSLEGPAKCRPSLKTIDDRHVRHVTPAIATLPLRFAATGQIANVQLRRGFGQYGLQEIPSGALDLFLHRGDSPGEGGSNVWFFSNWRARHAPLSHLFNVLKTKLRYPAVVGSDGSNCEIRELREAASSETMPSDFASHGLQWRLLGGLAGGRGRTVFWEVEPL